MNPLKPVNSTTVFFAGKEPEEKTDEVARLREENERLTESLKHVELWTKFEKQIGAQLEITSLRELLNRAIEVATEYQKHACKNINEDCDWSMHKTHERFDAIKSELTK